MHGTKAPPMGADGKVGVTFMHEFQSSVRPFLAKFGFNYMAWVAGAEFALRPEFDEARSFIRYGTETAKDIVRVLRRPILAEELFSGLKITDGHVIALNANPDQNRVEALLTLFNTMRYRVILAPAYSGLWFAKGHHFDIHSRRIRELRVEPELIPLTTPDSVQEIISTRLFSGPV